VFVLSHKAIPTIKQAVLGVLRRHGRVTQKTLLSTLVVAAPSWLRKRTRDVCSFDSSVKVIALQLLSINALPARTVTTTKIKAWGADHLNEHARISMYVNKVKWDTEDVSMIEYTGAWTGRESILSEFEQQTSLVGQILRERRHESSSTNNIHREGSVFGRRSLEPAEPRRQIPNLMTDMATELREETLANNEALRGLLRHYGLLRHPVCLPETVIQLVGEHCRDCTAALMRQTCKGWRAGVEPLFPLEEFTACFQALLPKLALPDEPTGIKEMSDVEEELRQVKCLREIHETALSSVAVVTAAERRDHVVPSDLRGHAEEVKRLLHQASQPPQGAHPPPREEELPCSKRAGCECSLCLESTAEMAIQAPEHWLQAWRFDCGLTVKAWRQKPSLVAATNGRPLAAA